MRALIFSTIGFGAVVSATSAQAERFAAKNILFEDVTGSVEIVTNSGDAIEVVIEQGDVYRRVVASLDDNGTVTVAGEPWREDDARDCCNDRIRRTVNLRKDRTLQKTSSPDDAFFAKYPTVKVVMPRNGDVTFTDARMKIAMGDLDGALNMDACYAYGEIGGVDEAVIGLVAGSRLVLGDVAAALEADLSGDADLLAGDAAMVDVDVAGPGDVILGSIDGMMDVSIAGSGNVRANDLVGPMTVRIAGSGAVAVRGGRADRLRATIDGSGGVLFDGLAIGPELRLYGSPEVRLRSVQGRIDHAGGGEVYVGGEQVDLD